jgi:hypothetical protein
MIWLDIILDHISKYGKNNITKLELDYLKNFYTNQKDDLEANLDNKYEFYKSLYYYEIEDAYWYDPNILISIDKDTIIDTRMNMLWDNIEIEDMETFTKIYKIPMIYLDFNWKNLPGKYQNKFKDFWEKYYNF